MAVVMNMSWAGVTPEQYEAARKVVNWEGNPPAGGHLHIAWFDSAGLRVTDFWESAEQFQQFVDTRLTPGVQQVGIKGEPKVDIAPAHAAWAPAALRR